MSQRWYGIIVEKCNYDEADLIVLKPSVPNDFQNWILVSGNNVLLNLSVACICSILDYDNPNTDYQSSLLLDFLHRATQINGEVHISLTDCEELSVTLSNYLWERKFDKKETI